MMPSANVASKPWQRRHVRSQCQLRLRHCQRAALKVLLGLFLQAYFVIEVIAPGSPLVKVPRVTFEDTVGARGITFHR